MKTTWTLQKIMKIQKIPGNCVDPSKNHDNYMGPSKNQENSNNPRKLYRPLKKS
jgi:hypothetical protein